MDRQLGVEKKKYEQLLSGVKSGEEAVRKEKQMAIGIGHDEEQLQKKLDDISRLLKKAGEGPKPAKPIPHGEIRQLERTAAGIRKEIESRKATLAKLTSQITDYESKIGSMRKGLMGYIAKQEAGKAEGKASNRTMLRKTARALEAKRKADAILKKAGSDASSLQQELESLLKKAKAYGSASGSKNMKARVNDFRSMLATIRRKQDSLRKEVALLGSTISGFRTKK
jgi:chromosome segregation ATPase